MFCRRSDHVCDLRFPAGGVLAFRSGFCTFISAWGCSLWNFIGFDASFASCAYDGTDGSFFRISAGGNSCGILFLPGKERNESDHAAHYLYVGTFCPGDSDFHRHPEFQAFLGNVSDARDQSYYFSYYFAWNHADLFQKDFISFPGQIS